MLRQNHQVTHGSIIVPSFNLHSFKQLVPQNTHELIKNWKSPSRLLVEDISEATTTEISPDKPLVAII